jgi:hypothetical protein
MPVCCLWRASFEHNALSGCRPAVRLCATLFHQCTSCQPLHSVQGHTLMCASCMFLWWPYQTGGWIGIGSTAPGRVPACPSVCPISSWLVTSHRLPGQTPTASATLWASSLHDTLGPPAAPATWCHLRLGTSHVSAKSWILQGTCPAGAQKQ